MVESKNINSLLAEVKVRKSLAFWQKKENREPSGRRKKIKSLPLEGKVSPKVTDEVYY